MALDIDYPVPIFRFVPVLCIFRHSSSLIFDVYFQIFFSLMDILPQNFSDH